MQVKHQRKEPVLSCFARLSAGALLCRLCGCAGSAPRWAVSEILKSAGTLRSLNFHAEVLRVGPEHRPAVADFPARADIVRARRAFRLLRLLPPARFLWWCGHLISA